MLKLKLENVRTPSQPQLVGRVEGMSSTVLPSWSSTVYLFACSKPNTTVPLHAAAAFVPVPAAPGHRSRASFLTGLCDSTAPSGLRCAPLDVPGNDQRLPVDNVRNLHDRHSVPSPPRTDGAGRHPEHEATERNRLQCPYCGTSRVQPQDECRSCVGISSSRARSQPAALLPVHDDD